MHIGERHVQLIASPVFNHYCVFCAAAQYRLLYAAVYAYSGIHMHNIIAGLKVYKILYGELVCKFAFRPSVLPKWPHWQYYRYVML